MPTEKTPLLRDQCRSDADPTQRAPSIEDCFDYERERILVIASLAGFIPTLASGCFVPSIPQISRDFHSTPAAVSLGISVSMFASAFGVMFWSAYSSFYGRRKAFICGTPFTILGSFAIMTSLNLQSMLCWRFVQMFGCSGSYAVGTASIGDVYKPEERRTAMGIFYGSMMAGVAMAPTLGGFFAQYSSWRGFQVALGVLGMTQFLLIMFFFPETAHPGTRGIDKISGSGKLPNIMAVALAHTFAIASDYILLTPIAYTIGAKYGIKSECFIGMLFLPNTLGNFVGAPIAACLSDWVMRRARQGHMVMRVPENRLCTAWLGQLVLIPVSVIVAGLITTYVDGTIGLVVCLICLFCNGVGVNMALTPIGAYVVDIMPTRSVEVMAAITSFRSLVIAPASALTIPSVETIGVAGTNSICAAWVMVGYGLIWLTMRYGKQMRAYVDIGFPDFDAQAPLSDELD